jgi:hypothetical protein
MDNSSPASESGPLDTNSAAAEFASMLGDPPKEQEAGETPEDAAARIASEELQGNEASTESESDSAEDTQKIPVTIDGKIVELTPSEIAEHYKNGLRQQDYTRKTMEIAEARKAAEAELSTARQERQIYAQQLQAMQQQIGQALGEQQNIDWQQLLDTDPVEYLRQQHLYNQRQAAYQQNQQEQQRIWQQQQAEQQNHIKKFLGEQREELFAKLPEWKDEGKMKAEREEIKTFLRDNAFNDDEINSIADHRHVLLARKAMMYDRLMEKAKAASKKVQPLPAKVERPGVTQSGAPDKRSAAFQRLSKEKSVEAGAAAFANFI